MKLRFTRQTLALAVASAIAVAGSAAFAAQGTPGGGGGGGGKPPVEVSNNLSYPILELTSGGAGGTIGAATTSVTPGTFGVNFSYGCPDPTYPDVAEYPNKSCVSSTGVFYAKDSAECQAICGTNPSLIERIYWQKVPGQKWKSEVIGPRGTEIAEYVDWGDALESRTVSATSVARVETMPFTTEPTPMQGFEMWHVFGTGKTEMWGARVTDWDSLQHYMYAGPNAIIHSGNARLNLAKLSAGAVTCPTTPSIYGASPYDGLYDPDLGPEEEQPVWDNQTQTWDGALFTTDILFNPELNIQGKYVHGYNWNLKTFQTVGVAKAGWWRLTFHASDVGFTEGTIIGPPVVPAATPGLPLQSLAAEAMEPESETEGRLYVALVRAPPDSLTFLDVCIAEAKGGGGRRPPQ